MKQADVAAALGVYPETVSRWETGDVPMSLAVLFRLADALHVGVHELLGVPASELSVEEIALVNEWRLLDKRGRKLLLDWLKWARK